LFEATPEEQAFKPSDTFYTKFKQANSASLFDAETKEVLKGKSSRIESVKLVDLLLQNITQMPNADKLYLEQCRQAIYDFNAISEAKLKEIKNMDLKSGINSIYNNLRNIITIGYLDRIYQMITRDENQPELILLIQELQ